jgi:hypothetical protein
MSTRFDQLLKKQQQIIELLTATNSKLDKICAAIISSQLLQETVSPDGDVRSADECANIVKDAFTAGLCLSHNMNEDQRSFEYSVREFYLEETEEKGDDEEPPTLDSAAVSPIF